MAFCINCGQQIPDNVSFCTNCGAPQNITIQPPHRDMANNEFGTTADDQSNVYGGNEESYTSNNQAYQSSSPYGGSYDSPADNGSGGGFSEGYSGGSSGGGPVPSPGFIENVSTCFSKYISFQGRARRSEYWHFVLFEILVLTVCGLVGSLLFPSHDPSDSMNILQSIASFAFFLPGWAVTVRRLHDIGKSGWWMLISLVPIAGVFILLYFECKDSMRGPNQFGPSPKYPMG